MQINLDDLLPTAEQTQLLDAVTGFLTREMPLDRFRSPDRKLEEDNWSSLAGLGCFGLSVAEADGGVGYTVVEESLIHGAFGRSLLGPSALATSLAVHLASTNGNGDLAAAFIDGSARAAAARQREKGGIQLFDGEMASHVVVFSRGRLALHAKADFTEFVQAECLDDSVVLHRAGLAPGAAALAADEGRLHRLAMLLASAYLAGIAEAVRDMAVGYAKIRNQFGKPIGSFQAIKHFAADMATAAESATALTHFAALAMRNAWGDEAAQVSAAKLVAARAAVTGAARNIQIHGGIGFTAECDAHRFLKRAHLMDRLSDGRAWHQNRIVAAMAA